MTDDMSEDNVFELSRSTQDSALAWWRDAASKTPIAIDVDAVAPSSPSHP